MVYQHLQTHFAGFGRICQTKFRAKHNNSTTLCHNLLPFNNLKMCRKLPPLTTLVHANAEFYVHLNTVSLGGYVKESPFNNLSCHILS
ncbi:hypothetical protein Pan54_44790 [Rubinisphaera italica]|uniref:Uncharacterized protein n=1 Tax=Rubinisphaera italica TaxID=2527969 RepID=A0A5C5XMM5_9PLAN|nr:hypothetical protein Pan54_44790 [Rubinisphaera italica]